VTVYVLLAWLVSGKVIVLGAQEQAMRFASLTDCYVAAVAMAQRLRDDMGYRGAVLTCTEAPSRWRVNEAPQPVPAPMPVPKDQKPKDFIEQRRSNTA
jgi:hypothetical protein